MPTYIEVNELPAITSVAGGSLLYVDEETSPSVYASRKGTAAQLAAYVIDVYLPANAIDVSAALGLGSAASLDVEDVATAAQGALADTAVQPGDSEITDKLVAANNLSDVANVTTSLANLGLSSVVLHNVVNDFTRQQAFTMTTLQDAADIAWDLNTNAVTQVTLAGNRTLLNPTNQKAGGTYIIIVRQDATGSRTLSYGNAYKWAGGTPPVVSPAASAVSILTFISDGTNMYGVSSLAFS